MFTIAIRLADAKAPKGKLADADLVFNNQTDMDGLILTGFSVWENTRDIGKRNVTFPARSYVVNGDRRSFALLREGSNQDEGHKARAWLTDLIVASYDEAVRANEATGTPPEPTTTGPRSTPAHAPQPPTRTRR